MTYVPTSCVTRYPDSHFSKRFRDQPRTRTSRSKSTGSIANQTRSTASRLPGLVAVGDAVCTTTLAGRGVALALMQARELMRTLDWHRADIGCATIKFDRWCENHIRPWFDDHRDVDADRMRRWSGGDVDLRRPPPVGPHRRGRRGRPGAAGHRRPLFLDGRIARKPRARRGPRSGIVRKRLAPLDPGRPDPRRAQRGGVQDTGSRLMP